MKNTGKWKREQRRYGWAGGRKITNKQNLPPTFTQKYAETCGISADLFQSSMSPGKMCIYIYTHTQKSSLPHLVCADYLLSPVEKSKFFTGMCSNDKHIHNSIDAINDDFMHEE